LVGTKVLGVVEGGTIELHGKVSGQYFSYLLISFFKKNKLYQTIL